MSCTRCAAAVRPDDRFCAACGMPTAAAAAAHMTGPAGAAPRLGNVLEEFESRLNKLAGTDKLEGFSLQEMFSEVFKRRTGSSARAPRWQASG